MTSIQHRARGFTAIELMIVITIAAILLAVAIPNFADLMRRYRATTAANEILRTLTMARAQGLSTGQRVAVAPMTAGNWASGWRVFVDVNNNGVYNNGTDTQIEVFAALASDMSLSGTTFGEGGNTFISFNQFGFARALNGTTIVSGRIGLTLGTNDLSVCLATNGRAAVLKGSSC